MPEISLDALGAGRDGVKLALLELRRMTTSVSDEAVTAQGLAAMLEGRVFVFPQKLATTSTVCHARVIKSDDRYQWHLTWQEIIGSPEEIPGDLREQSKTLGGMTGLEQRLGELWKDDTAPGSLLIATYEFPRGASLAPKLLRKSTVRLDELELKQTGAFWEVGKSASGLLAAVSFMRGPKRAISAGAVARVTSTGWPDVAALEARVWQDFRSVLASEKNDEA